MKLHRNIGCGIVLLALALALSLGCAERKTTASGSAQALMQGIPTQSTGTLEGAIADESGQPVIGAMVQVTGPTLPGFLGAATDTTGHYRVIGVPSGGNYRVKVEAPGYNAVVRKGLSMSPGLTVTLPFVLSQGKTEIVVTAAAPMIDTKRTECGATFGGVMGGMMGGGSGGYSGGSSRKSRGASPGGIEGGVSGGVEGGVLGGTLGGATFLAPSAAPSGAPAAGASFSDELLVIEGASNDYATDASAMPEHPSSPGSLRAQKATGEDVGEFPLQHTSVEAFVDGYLARTVVRQRYANPYQEVIEAVYVFPLGAMAAVHDFVMQVGPRRIVGVVRPREEAEQIYREAKERGQTASLLTQERPNVFTQNVANIEPGGSVEITLTTFETLPCEKGTYEYVFPMVVGPRYVPGVASPAPETASATGGQGWAAPTDAVPDAPKITPPVLKPGERSGHDIDLTVHLDAGLPVTGVTSVAHQVSTEEIGPTRRLVTLSPADGIPNRDFVLRWSVDASQMRFGVLAHREKGDGCFTLMVQPPLAPSDSEVSSREITFILDVSGSMSGLPVETSKSLVRKVLDGLRPDDTFNVFVFSGSEGQLWQAPHPNTPENVLAAKRYLDDLQGSGGTEMLSGVRHALHGEHDPWRLQMYVFCTDGFVGDEGRILALVEKERGAARFFAFGIGSSVNRYLIEGVGRVGGGKAMVIMPRDPGAAHRASERFFECIDSPVLTEAAVDWNGLPVRDVYPGRIGDLFAGGTLNLVGRYDGPAEGTAFLTGSVGSKQVRIPIRVSLPAEAPERSELGPVWARYKIADLSAEMLTADAARQPELEKAITDLAVQHRLVSPYTAFVAVDESRVVGDGRPLKVMQPVEMPEGVSYAGVFGETGVGGVSALPTWGLRLQETASGAVRVGVVEDAGPAARAGVKAGASLRAVGGVSVHDVGHLEGLLLQCASREVKVTFDPGGEVVLPAP
jgi:Ca-activated chloride channel homolog